MYTYTIFNVDGTEKIFEAEDHQYVPKVDKEGIPTGKILFVLTKKKGKIKIPSEKVQGWKRVEL